MAIVQCYGFHNIIDIPTRVTLETATVIDLCITNCNPNELTGGVLTWNVSDHLPTFCLFKRLRKSPMSFPCITYRPISKENLDMFYSSVSNINWDFVYNESDPDISYNLFLSKLISLYDNVFPLRTLKKHKKSRKPWVTPTLYKRIKYRDSIYDKFIKLRDKDIIVKFKKVRNKLNSDLKKARREYYINKFMSILGDPKKIWSTVGTLISRPSDPPPTELKIDGKSYGGKQLSDLFNTHFLTSGACSSSPTNAANVISYIRNNVTSTIFFSPTDEEEISTLIACLKNSTAPGEDGLKAEPIKFISSLILTPLTHICNTSLLTGRFPDRMKVARVCVVHKGGVRNDLNNYRPISVLPVFSKILGQIINNCLTSFFTKHNIISEQQFGF